MVLEYFFLGWINKIPPRFMRTGFVPRNTFQDVAGEGEPWSWNGTPVENGHC
jgi:hypothetical protein